MKGIVLEKNNRYAIIADNKGKFHKIKDVNGLEVGQEYNRGLSLSFNRGFMYKLSAIVMAMAIGTMGFQYKRPDYYVTLDINPSVQLASNIWGRVVSVKALNDDGKKISGSLELSGGKTGDALEKLIYAAKEQGFLKEGQENDIAVTLSSDDKNTEKIEASIEEQINKELKDENLGSTQVIMQNTNLERFREAEKLGISPGKMLLIDKLKDLSPEINPQDYANKPVKEIMKSINDIKKENKVQDKDKAQDKDSKAQNKDVKSQEQNQEQSQEKSEVKEDNNNSEGQLHKKDLNSNSLRGNQGSKNNEKVK